MEDKTWESSFLFITHWKVNILFMNSPSWRNHSFYLLFSSMLVSIRTFFFTYSIHLFKGIYIWKSLRIKRKKERKKKRRILFKKQQKTIKRKKTTNSQIRSTFILTGIHPIVLALKHGHCFQIQSTNTTHKCFLHSVFILLFFTVQTQNLSFCLFQSSS